MDNKEIKLLPFTIESKVSNLDYTIPYGIDLINAKKVWDKGFTGKGVVIAVIDTGCYTKHESLKGRIIGGRNFTADNNSNPNVYEDYQGHGTHVAGTIAANMSPRGITGVAPGASLLILKALDRNGRGKVEWVINAIDYAISQKVDIISLSFESNIYAKEMHNAVNRLIEKDILVVCAAGNRCGNNVNTREDRYPRASIKVIEVGAIDNNKNAAPFSDANGYLGLVAPGVSILSTYKNGGYARLSGTSMAAPHVIGALALLIEWSRCEFGRKLKEEELYVQLIKNTVPLAMDRNIQGNRHVFLDIYVANK